MDVIDEARRLLEPRLGKRLLTRESAEFEERASVVFAGDDDPPALVARARDAEEVSAVVRGAASTGIPFAVRGGGHGYLRQGTVANGLVLDLRLLAGAEADPAARVGVAFAGTTAGEYTAVAERHGLATGFGDTASVGVPGIALGGGIGFLSRRDGLTVDNMLSAEVVLADGSLVEASETANADLFWALRGGGGNFGVVTRLRLRLSEAGIVTGGILAFEPDPRTVSALVAAAAEAPDELSLMINVMKAPPAPFLPPERHGTPIVIAILCHSGDPERADAALAPFRSAGRVLVDLVRRQQYSALFAVAPPLSGVRTTQRTGFFDGVDDALAGAALDAIHGAPTATAVLNLRPMGAAIARVESDATAFAHRGRALMATIGAADLDSGRANAGRDWAESTAASLGVGGAAYLNFLGESGPEATASAYPAATLSRLRAVKRQFDPQNLFRSNHNIAPIPDDDLARV